MEMDDLTNSVTGISATFSENFKNVYLKSILNLLKRNVNNINGTTFFTKSRYYDISAILNEYFLINYHMFIKIYGLMTICDISLLATIFILVLYLYSKLIYHVYNKRFHCSKSSNCLHQLRNTIQKNRLSWIKHINNEMVEENDALKNEIQQCRDQANTLKDITLDQVDHLESELCNYRSLVDRLNSENSKMKKNHDKIRKEIDIKENKISELEKNLSMLSEKNNDLEKKCEKTSDLVVDLQQQICNLQNQIKEEKDENQKMKDKLALEADHILEAQKLYRAQKFANKLLADELSKYLPVNVHNTENANDDDENKDQELTISSVDLPNLFSDEANECKNLSFFSNWIRSASEKETKFVALEEEAITLKKQLETLEASYKENTLQCKFYKDSTVELTTKNELLEVELASIKKLHNEQAERYFKEIDLYKEKNRELTNELSSKNSHPSEIIKRDFEQYIKENERQISYLKKKIDELTQEKQNIYIKYCTSKRENDELLKEREYYREKLVLLTDGNKDILEHSSIIKHHSNSFTVRNGSVLSRKNESYDSSLGVNTSVTNNVKQSPIFSAVYSNNNSFNEEIQKNDNSIKDNNTSGDEEYYSSSSSSNESVFSTQQQKNLPPPPPLPPIWMQKMAGFMNTVNANPNNIYINRTLNSNPFHIPNYTDQNINMERINYNYLSNVQTNNLSYPYNYSLSNSSLNNQFSHINGPSKLVNITENHVNYMQSNPNINSLTNATPSEISNQSVYDSNTFINPQCDAMSYYSGNLAHSYNQNEETNIFYTNHNAYDNQHSSNGNC